MVQIIKSVYDYLKKDTKILSTKLKEKLIKERILDYECYLCNITSWNNKPITLQLDHINGDFFDNRLENLRILCPNCHSQTPTFRSWNKVLNKKLCLDCNCNLNRGTLRCRNCYLTTLPQKNKENKKIINEKTITICLDCEIQISRQSLRCKKCARKHNSILKIEYPLMENIILNIKNSSFLAYSKLLGISDNGLRKHLKRNGYNPKTLGKF